MKNKIGNSHGFTTKSILLVIHSKQELSELLNISVKLADCGRFSFTFRFAGKWVDQETVNLIESKFDNAIIATDSGGLISARDFSVSDQPPANVPWPLIVAMTLGSFVNKLTYLAKPFIALVYASLKTVLTWPFSLSRNILSALKFGSTKPVVLVLSGVRFVAAPIYQLLRRTPAIIRRSDYQIQRSSQRAQAYLFSSPSLFSLLVTFVAFAPYTILKITIRVFLLIILELHETTSFIALHIVKVSLQLFRKTSTALFKPRKLSNSNSFNIKQKVTSNYTTLLNSKAAQSIRYFFGFRVGLSHSRKILNKVKPDIVLAAEGTFPYEIMFYAALLKRKRTPIVIFPYTVANWEEYFNAYKFAPMYQHDNRYTNIAKKFDPQLFLEHDGVELIRVPFYAYFTYKVHGILPEPAWAMNSLPVERILVESIFIQDYFKKSGIPASKLKIVGSTELDSVLCNKEERSKRLQDISKTYKRNSNQKIVLCCPPPDQGNRGLVDFESYELFLNEFITAINETFVNHVIIYRFHPRLSIEDVKKLEEKFGIKSSKQNTSWLISISDIYITSVSATIRWALAASIPILNYDVYGYNYSEYDGIESVLTSTDFSEFKAQLLEMSNPLVYKKFKDLSENQSTYWGFSETSSFQRIEKELSQVLEK
ncbi:MAG: hypothetical protein AB8B81_05715 [Halioglobus sp.]